MRLGRGDMAEWTDDGQPVPPPGGPLLLQLVATALPTGGHVLVAGLHAVELLDAIAERADKVTLLLRGDVDGMRATERHGVEVMVLVGDVSALARDARFDALVALDGLVRLVSYHLDAPNWKDVYEQLTTRLNPQATVLLAVDSPLSAQALGGVPAREAADADPDWRPMDLLDATAPQTYAQMRQLGDRVWCLHPSVRHPTLVEDPGRVPHALALAHSTGPAYRLDPRATMQRATSAGMAANLSPGWLLARGPLADGLPQAWVSNPSGAGISELREVAGTVQETLVTVDPDRACEGWTTGPAGATRPVREGTLLELDFLAACARRDTASVRQLLRSVASTVLSADAHERAHWVAGTFDNVIVDDCGVLSLLDRSTRFVPDVPAETLLIGLFRDAAQRLFDLGWRHPWPMALGVEEVARLMAAVVGLDVSLDAVSEAHERQRRADDLRSRHRILSPDVVSDALRRLEHVNEALRSKTAWFERAMPALSKQVAAFQAKSTAEVRLQNQLDHVRRSRSYRAGHALTQPGRALVRTKAGRAMALSRPGRALRRVLRV